jgi:hypothetical protein
MIDNLPIKSGSIVKIKDEILRKSNIPESEGKIISSRNTNSGVVYRIKFKKTVDELNHYWIESIIGSPKINPLIKWINKK